MCLIKLVWRRTDGCTDQTNGVSGDPTQNRIGLIIAAVAIFGSRAHDGHRLVPTQATGNLDQGCRGRRYNHTTTRSSRKTKPSEKVTASKAVKAQTEKTPASPEAVKETPKAEQVAASVTSSSTASKRTSKPRYE